MAGTHGYWYLVIGPWGEYVFRFAGGDIEHSYTEGSITGTKGSAAVGGLVGQFYGGTIKDCFSTVAVQGREELGGVVGANAEGIVSNCYSTGDVNGVDEVGGLVGDNHMGSVSNCFWDTDTQTHGVVDSISHDYDGTVTNVAGLPTAQMQTRDTFISAGWDFAGETANGTEDIWSICQGMNYPRLVWQIPGADLLCPDGVYFVDYSFFASHWLDDNCADSNDCQGADLNQSGGVDLSDLLIFVEEWLVGVDAGVARLLARATTPIPTDGAEDVNTNTDLSWAAAYHAASYDVYFGPNSPPPFIQNQVATTFDPGTMACDATYYWRIDEVNPFGVTTGEVWTFTIPYPEAQDPNPGDGAIDVGMEANLSWMPGCGATSHDVYFGPNSPPPFIQNQVSTTFDPGKMDGLTTYFWRIDEVNPTGTTTGGVWYFTTEVKGRFCFPAGTLVWAETTLVQISGIVPGQELGRLTAVSTQVPRPQIESIDEHAGAFEYYDIILESGNQISVVGSHLFLLDSGQWTHAGSLRVASKLKSLKGSVSISTISRRSYTGKVYNLKIKNSDRYFVGNDGIVVRDY